MAHRTIFDHDPDPVRLFDELYFRGARDFKGLPLGDVVGHAGRRYTACYGALCLARMLTELGRIDNAVPLDVVGAQFQDKQTSAEFPAAHAIPCDLVLALPGHPHPGVHLYDLLRNPFNRTWALRHIFGQTDRVHRLVNVADRSCERGSDGMALALAAACEEVIRDGLRARTAVTEEGPARDVQPISFQFDILVQRFTEVARTRLRALENKLTGYERTEMTRGHPVDRFGRPLVERPVDTRVNSSDAEARAAARIALRQVLQIYADPPPVDTSALGAMAGKIQALQLNERGH